MSIIGEFFALSAAFLWAGSSFIFTAAQKKLGSFALNFWRLLLASFLIFITLLITGINFHITTNQFIYLLISGFLGLVIGDTFILQAFAEIGPRYSLLIWSINPALSAIFAYLFLNEGLSLLGIIGITITIFGIAIVVMDKNSDERYKFTLKGIIFGFISALGQAIGLIFAKFAFVEADINGLLATFYRISTSAGILAFISLLFKNYKLNFNILIKDRIALLLVVIGSIIGPFLGILFSFLAIIYTKVGIAATLMSTVPILILPISYFYNKEKLTFLSIAGAFITVAGIALLFLYKDT